MLYDKSRTKELQPSLFENPSSEYRGAPFWAWNCKLTRELLTEQIEVLKEMGFGGFHMHPRTGFATTYLSPEHMQLVRACVDKARQEQMYSYLYDEDRWPSGAAGGLVTKNPEYRQRYLNFTPEAHEMAEHEVLLGCYDIELDENGCLKKYKMISAEQAAAGVKWFASLKTMDESPWYNNETYVDTLNKKAIDQFIQVTYETYRESIGEEFGKTAPSIFTDEPQFSWKGTLSYPEEKQTIMLPWTDDLAETFQETYGENLLENLPQLFWELPDGKVSVIRYHYHDHVTERFTEAFADNCGNWCAEHHLMLTGHVLAEESLYSQTASVGEAMRAYRSFQLPGIDMLCNNYEYTTAKQAQSAAHQFGREGVMSELYGVTGWQFDFRGHKMQGDWQAALGVTLRVPHLSWVSMGGEAKRDYPASINYQSPWFREYSYIEDHFARVNTALTRGKPVVRVGVIHPIESYWLHWGPSQQTLAVRDELDTNFHNVAQWLLFGGIDFDYICESLLPEQCEEASVPLKVGEMEYDVVVVPGCETLRSTTVKRLKKFRKQGGRLIFLGKAPAYMDAVESEKPGELYEKSEQLPFSRAALLKALENVREVEFRENNGALNDDLIYQLRQDQNCRWLFIAHGKEPRFKDNDMPQEIQITLAGNWSVTRYDTLTGKTAPLAVTFRENKTVLKCVFHNHDSLLLQLTTPKSVFIGATECHHVSAPLTLPKVVPITLEEPNVLLLDQAEYALDDGEYAPAEEILRADNHLRKMLGYPSRQDAVAQPWTIPEEPFEHTAKLKMTFESLVETEPVQLALEDAERVKIVFNGEKIPSVLTGWYVDKSIKTVSIGKIRKGSNVLELEVPFGKRANLEWCYVLGDFGVRVRGREAVVTEPVRELGFGDITGQGLPFYGGNVHYKVPTGETSGQLEVHIPHYRGALVKVSSEGEQKKIVFAPYTAVISAPKDGILDITLFGNRANSFGALHRIDERNNWLGPDSWRTTGDQWSDSYRLFTTGILSSPIIRKMD